jgi:phosphate:Na+ symporter
VGILSLIYSLLVIFGALAFFLFGMKLMSESLQKIAGSSMREYLSAITSNPWKGMGTGFLLTIILQSSSVSTVMLVGFVNAGLVTVLESVGLVIGANIGTTLTAWLVSFFGYSFNIRFLLLPLIALSIPLYLTSNSKRKSIAEFVMGFAILFFGLNFLREALPAIGTDSGIITLLSSHPTQGFGSLVLIAVISLAITLVIQSSTAAITLTMVLFSDGYITLEVAGAMIIGQNIGTTITANIAALVANRNAKQTALIHLLFNLIGAILFIPFFGGFVRAIDHAGDLLLNFELIGSSLVNPIKVSLFHSGFNILVMIVLIWFTKHLVSLANFMLPVKTGTQPDHKLTYHDSFMVSAPELLIANVSKELNQMSSYVVRMYMMVPKLMLEKDVESYEIMYHDLKRMEQETDRLEAEIMNYLTRISESKLSSEGSRLVHAMLTVVNNLESIADVCFKMSRVIDNKNKAKAWFTQDQRNKLNEMHELVSNALSFMCQSLLKPGQITLDEAERLEQLINDKRRQFVEDHLADLKKANYSLSSGNFYQQLIVYSEKIGDHATNVNEALYKSVKQQ